MLALSSFLTAAFLFVFVGVSCWNFGSFPFQNKLAHSANWLSVVEKQKEEEFVFSDISERPIPSILRGYSAPIRLESDLSDSDLFFLLANDSDEFNRFVFAETLILSFIWRWVVHAEFKDLLFFLVGKLDRCWQGNWCSAWWLISNKTNHWFWIQSLCMASEVCLVIQAWTKYDEGFLFISDLGGVVVVEEDECTNQLELYFLIQEFIAKAITLPGEGEIMDMMEVADPDAVHAVRTFIRKQLASELKAEFLTTVCCVLWRDIALNKWIYFISFSLHRDWSLLMHELWNFLYCTGGK